MVTLRSRPVLASAAGTVAPDPAAQAASVRSLVQRLADDAVYVRTTTASASTSPTTTTSSTTGSETTLLEGFSEDLAVPASRLTAMPGCVR